MFCKNCGTQYAEGQKFCPTCGTAIEQAAAPAAPVVPVAPVEPVQQVQYEAPVQPTVSAEPYGAPVPPMAPPPAPKKSNKGLVIAISIIIAVLIAAGACLAIFWDDLFGKKSSKNDKDDTTSDVSDIDDENAGDIIVEDEDVAGEGYNSELNGNDTEVNLDDYLNSSNQAQAQASTQTNSTGTYTTAQEFMNSAEGAQAQQMLNETAQGTGATITLRAVNNHMFYDVKYENQVDASAASASLQNYLQSNSATFNLQASNFQKYITTPGVTMTVRYLNADGTVLAEATFPQ